MLDQLGAFLADVDKDVYNEDNWKTTKTGRQIMADDASFILAYYSIVSTGEDDLQKAWNSVFANPVEEKSREYLFDQYVTLDKFIEEQQTTE